MSKRNTLWVVVETESQLIQTRRGRLCLWLTEDGAKEGLERLAACETNQGKYCGVKQARRSLEVREADLILRPVLNKEREKELSDRQSEAVGPLKGDMEENFPVVEPENAVNPLRGDIEGNFNSV